MRRISVIGTSGSGKTTLAEQLAQRLGIPHIEIDALHWKPNWTPASPGQLRADLASRLGAEAWTICGNYSSVRDLIWARADTIIWLDYPMSIVARRVVLRTLRRCWTQEELWSGNRERFFVQLFTTDSLYLWVINTWRKHRRDYPKLLKSAAERGIRVLRFHSPGETRKWLETIRSGMPEAIDCLS